MLSCRLIYDQNGGQIARSCDKWRKLSITQGE